ncbi:MAG: hypothetical protein U9R50_01050 [Campylobacterota bacterium]|nr:hypothetical protein [Campylobacterota bacterium]
MNRIASVLLFFAVSFLIFHDQITLIHSADNTIEKSCHISYEICSKIDLHEQLHAYTIAFDRENIVFSQFPQFLINTKVHKIYEFITFNPPYRPPSV